MDAQIQFTAQYWIQELFGLVGISIGLLWKKGKEYKIRQKESQDGLKVLLKADLYERSLRCKKQGYVMADEREIIDEEFEAYFALGGNGVGHKVKKELDVLETRL